MELTYNQILKRLRSLALSHRQIDSFHKGDPWEFTVNGDIVFAAIFVETLPGVINRTERQIRHNFKITLLDRVGVSNDTEGNEQEVISDMMSVAADYLAMIGSEQWDDWEINAATAFTPVTEMLDDMAAGVTMDVSINVNHVFDVCQVPRDAIITEDGFDILTENNEQIIP